MKTPVVKFLLCSVAMLMMISLAAMPASAAINGALQTTNPNGTVVNYNTGLPCDQVYISGGPQNTNDAGLSPVGSNVTYYFQVTDPSGKVVLSTDTGVVNGNVNDRQLTTGTVNGKGVVTGTTGSHLTGGVGPSGETTVQLWPFNQTPNNGGVYKAWISTDPSFLNSTTKTDNFKCTPVPTDFCTENPRDPSCQTPPPSAAIVGEKYYDSNANGSLDTGELGIQGWLTTISPTTGLQGASCSLTDSLGGYLYAVDPDTNTTYTITEADALQPAWIHTTATSGTATAGHDTIQGPNFGNVCVGAGGGLTLGFWSNKNGQALEVASDFSLLTGLNLVNADGSARDFTDTLAKNKTALNSWLLNANAVNMAYMLSAQLAAMELNVQHTSTSHVNPSALVYMGPPPTLTTLTSCFGAAGEIAPNAANFITVSDLMTDANIELGLYPNTVSSTDYRKCEEYKKTALDKANNSLNFLQADQSSCPAFTFANSCQ